MRNHSHFVERRFWGHSVQIRVLVQEGSRAIINSPLLVLCKCVLLNGDIWALPGALALALNEFYAFSELNEQVE